MDFTGYDTANFYDELFDGRGRSRPGSEPLLQTLAALPARELQRRQQAAERALLLQGITFSVYGDAAGTERIFPFDIIPRIVLRHEWDDLAAGLEQRIRALNLFLDDIYSEQRILRDRVIPRDLVEGAAGYRSACRDLRPPHGIWCHVAGTDLLRSGDGRFHVLEDNLRCPSGVSYVLENRVVMKQTFPALFDSCKVLPVNDYPNRLLDMLQHLAPTREHPRVAVLTPGSYNSAYFEHAFLAQQMGVPMVEGRDLTTVGGEVMMRTTKGLERVDVLYRRIDDDFLDPTVFRSDSLLGVVGLMEAYRNGRVALANAPGTGVADDKAIYAFVPAMILYYLSEDALLPNVPTFGCWNERERTHVLANLDTMVVKSVNGSGGYGMLIGPHASTAERDDFARRIRASPRSYIGQPTIDLSRAPVLADDRLEGRHVDLRPFTLTGKETYTLPGGLTRVALKKGSLVVNSSQGGGSKDTWVVEAPDPHPVARGEKEAGRAQ